MKIPYGISNFEVLRREKYFYVDKTQYIPILEEIARYIFFIRPRRFGKSLFLSMLEHYYDLKDVGQFETIFGDLRIGQKPTELKNNFFVLKLNFSGLDTSTEENLKSSFNTAILSSILHFFSYYRDYFTGADKIIEEVKSSTDLRQMMEKLFNAVSQAGHKVYLIIDEYDHFANDIIAMGDENYYKNVIQARGFVRDFYETVKIGTEGVIDRIFITGISPIMLDDMTSGFNISSNLTTLSNVNEMLGFTEEEVRSLIERFGQIKEMDTLVVKLRSYYNGYLFNAKAAKRVYNPEMIMYFFDQWRITGEFPEKLIDENVKTDYDRLNRLMANQENREMLERITREEGIVAEIVSKFSFDQMYDQRYFVSLLFYLGLLTISGTKYGMTELGIPNFVIRTIYWEQLKYQLEKGYMLKYDTVELQKAIWEMAHDGKVC